jgi:hypothetical protein
MHKGKGKEDRGSCPEKDLPATFDISVSLHPSLFEPSKQVNEQLSNWHYGYKELHTVQ